MDTHAFWEVSRLTISISVGHSSSHLPTVSGIEQTPRMQIYFTSWPCVTHMKYRARLLSVALLSLALAGEFLLPPRAAVIVYAVAFVALFVILNSFTGWSLSHPFAFMTFSAILLYIGPALDLITLTQQERTEILLGSGYAVLARGELVILVGIALLLIGFSLDTGRRLGDRLPSFPQRWDINRVNKVLAVFASISIVGFMILISSIDLSTISAKRSLPTVYIKWLVEFSLFGGLIAFLSVLDRNDQFRSRYGLVWASFLGLLLVYCVIVSGRSTILWAAILFLALYVQYRPLRAFRVAGAGLAMVVFSGVVGALRSGGGIGGVIASPVVLLDSVFGARRGYLPAVANIVELTPGTLKFRYGETLIQWVVFPIPRSVWAGKPESVGSQVAAQVYNHPSGMPPTIVGDLYWNGAIFGVVVGMLALGVVLRGVDTYRRSAHSVASVALATVCLIELSTFNDVSKLIIDLLLIAVPVVAALFYISHGDRRVLAFAKSMFEGEGGKWLSRAIETSVVVGMARSSRQKIASAASRSKVIAFLSRFDQAPNERS